MRVLITGSSGFVGSKLVPFLQDKGLETFCLVRQPTSDPHKIFWNPEQGKVPDARLEGFHAVIHLAGSNIAKKKMVSCGKKRTISEPVSHNMVISTCISPIKSSS